MTKADLASFDLHFEALFKFVVALHEVPANKIPRT